MGGGVWDGYGRNIITSSAVDHFPLNCPLVRLKRSSVLDTSNQPTSDSFRIVTGRSNDHVSTGGRNGGIYAFKAVLTSAHTCCGYTDLHTSKHLSTNV